jgi:hypothetical protein
MEEDPTGEPVQRLLIYPDKRVEEIAPDGTIVPQKAEPANDPSLYLRDASRALRDCGSAPALYAGWRSEDRGAASEGFAYQGAPTRRTEFARTSILFSSFAAEAFVNDYLQAGLGAGYTDEMKRSRTIDKYVRLVRRVSPSVAISRGRQPGQGLVQLFRARNYLVHPRRDAEPRDAITPLLAAQCLISVSEAVRMLTADLGKPNIYALLVSKHRGVVRNYARRAMNELPELDAPAPPEPVVQLMNREVGPQLRQVVARQRLGASSAEPS